MTGEILSAFSELGEIINWAANHHEKLDGSGYPLHLNQDYLQLPDRIIAIADIFTALTEDRPYRVAMRYQDALQLIENDVINGALDKDVFVRYASMPTRYIARLFGKNATNPLPANGQKRVL